MTAKLQSASTGDIPFLINLLSSSGLIPKEVNATITCAVDSAFTPSIEAKLPNHIGKKEVREINEDIRTIQSAREKLVELKNKIRRSELTCKAIFLNAKEQLEKRKSRSNQTEVRKEIPTHSREEWQTFLRRKAAEIKAKKEAEQKKQFTEKTATKTQTNEPKIAQEPSDKDVERAALGLLGLLNLIQAFDQPVRPRSSRDELENLLRGIRGF